MKCYRCETPVLPGTSAIRGMSVPYRTVHSKVGARAFRRVRLCWACIGDRQWAQIKADRERFGRDY